MKRIILFSLILFVITLFALGCNTGVIPQTGTFTPTPIINSPTPTPTQETTLKFWAEPTVVPFDPTQNTWSYTIRVSVEGNEYVTLTKLEVYDRVTENSSFTYHNTYYQAQMQSWSYWKIHLSPGDMIHFTAYFVHTPPYQRKFILYGETQSGKMITAEMVVTFLPKS